MGLHLHEMRDTDKHFIIDPVTRAITNANAAKNKLIQFDHNSEIFTFEIPQYVDGHDMNKCDKVEIHYINIDGKTKEQSKDLFNAKAAAKTDSDLVFNLEGEKLLFCWKISGNATKYAGSLNFLVCFSCLDDAGAITYKWHTDIFKGIIISDGLSNTEAVAEQYSDVLEQWKKELENASGSGSGSGGSYVVNIIDNGDNTFRTDKTFAQIQEAIAAGKEAVCVFGTYHYQLVSCTDTKIVFSVSECEGVISYKTFTIDNTNGDGEVIYKFDMPGYQYSTDGNLQTEDITVVGAINELNTKVNGVINNGTVISENADFAEVGEWSDGNPDAEDRTGYFVTVDTSEPGKTMVKATSSSDIRGVTMLQPAFAGNASADKYDSDGNLLKQYAYVGFAGFVPVIDNGTCEVNGHCMPADDGTAIPSPNNMGYQVIERIDDTHVLVLVEPQVDMMVRIKEDVSHLSEDKVDNPLTGKVGQILEIETVDESGKPKTYKAVNKPSGGGEVTDEQISNAVDNYMASNPIEENDPTVPAWAKQENKPTYTASEVGALPDTTKYLPNPKPITFTGNSDSKSYTGNSSLVIDIPSYVNIPESLKNPYSLTFTGAFNGSYDGSENVTVNIPVGSDNGTLSVGYVNALEYGLVGDGITDNLALFNQMVSENPGKTIYFGSGVYCFSGQLNIQKAYIVLDGAELKLTSSSNQTYFIKVLGYQKEGTEFPQDDMFIRGNGTINANKKANVALGIGTQKMMQISGLKITGFLQTGLLNGFDDRSGYCYELQASNLLIYNTEILYNSVAIISGADSTFRDIVTLNVKTAINVVAGGNIFSNIHSWNFDFTYANKTSVAGTRFAYITTRNSRFSDCYIDTCQYGFVLADGAKQVMITNLFWFINSETYPSGYTPVVFTPNPSVDSKFYVCNAYLPSSYGAKFSETALDSSTFYNVVSDMQNAVNFSGVGSSSSSGVSNPLTEDLNFNKFFAANVGGFSFPQNSRGRSAYLGQIDRYINSDKIPVLRIQRWDAPTNSNLPVIITGVDTPTEDTDAANKSYVDSLISGVETLLGGGF